jgi:hypothetical protein
MVNASPSKLSYEPALPSRKLAIDYSTIWRVIVSRFAARTIFPPLQFLETEAQATVRMPSSSRKPDKRELLIFDTGPIREMVTFYAVEQYGFERLRGDLQLIRDPEAYSQCSKFIASFRRKTTSASVVAELNYWIRKTEPTGQERLWNRVYEEFREMGMDEEVVRLLQMVSADEMGLALLTRLGPVDVSLMGLVRRHAGERPLVLTTDGELCKECERAGLRVSHLREVMLMVP